MEEQIQAIIELIVAGGNAKDKEELIEIAKRIEKRIQERW